MGVRTVEELASPQARVRVYWSLARLAWWDAQDPDTALRYAREALALYRTTEDTRGLALAHVLTASLLNLERKWQEAERHLARAEMILTAAGFLTEHRQWREATMVAREWADLHKSLGQTDKALELMERASTFSFRVALPAVPEAQLGRSR